MSKLPNKFGSITKLKAPNLRRPYMARVYAGKKVNFETKKAYPVQKILGYYATKSEAMKALAEYNANPYNLDRHSVTIKEIWQQVKPKVDVSEDRMKKYESNFRLYISPIENMKISDIKTAALQDLIDAIPYGYSTQSITRSVLNHIFSYAVQNDIVQQNYVDYLKLDSPKTEIERQLYTPEEIADLWQNAAIPEYAMTLILLYEGMRIKELRELPKKAVDLTKWTLEISEAKNVQSKRIIPLNRKIRGLITEAMKSPGDLLFGFSKQHYDYFVKTNLKHTPYDTRHTFASQANKIGLPKLTIQRIMGHKPDSVLEQAYIHLSMDELQEAIDKIIY